MRSAAPVRQSVRVVPLVLLLAAGTACSSGDTPRQTAPSVPPVVATTTAPDSPASSPSASSTAPAASSAPASASPPAARGCPPTSGGVPAGAARRNTVDVDGDGRTDTLFFAPGADRTVGIRTASGAVFSRDVPSASPVAGSALLVQPTGRGPFDVLVSFGRGAAVLVVDGCRLSTLTNAQGQPYTFDLGDFSGNGTGVGCVGPAGRGLTGLRAVSSDSGKTYTITRTSITQSGTRLRNGTRDTLTATSPKDDALIRSAQSVTCGDATLARDGLAQPEG